MIVYPTVELRLDILEKFVIDSNFYSHVTEQKKQYDK